MPLEHVARARRSIAWASVSGSSAGPPAPRERARRRPGRAARAAASRPRRSPSCGRAHRLERTVADRARASSRYSAASSSPVRLPAGDEPAAEREQRVARVVRADLLARPVRGLEVGAGVAQEAHGSKVEDRRDAGARGPTRRARCAVASSSLRASSPSARSIASSGRPWSDCSTHASGVGTLIPRPLSSQTKSSGSGVPPYARCAAVLSAACAVAWLSDASPNEQTTTASSGQAHSTPSSRARSIAKAIPTARGRCEAIVEVCGITARSCVAEDLVAAAGDRLLGRRGHAEEDVPDAVSPGLAGTREVEAAGSVVEERRVGRLERERDERVRLVARRADRVEAEALRLEPPRRMVDRAALDACARHADLRLEWRPLSAGAGGTAPEARRRGAARVGRDRRSRARTLPGEPRR